MSSLRQPSTDDESPYLKRVQKEYLFRSVIFYKNEARNLLG